VSVSLSLMSHSMTLATTPTSIRHTNTKQRILDAARQLILDRHPAALTVAQIASEAGVSERTIYRYFPSKRDLITSVAEHPPASIPNLPMPETWEEARGALRVSWTLFGQDLDVVRSERLIPEGLELRKARLESARPMAAAILDNYPKSHPRDQYALRELLLHLTSSTTLLELVDRHGLTVEGAIDCVIGACQTLLEHGLDADRKRSR